MAIPIAPPRRLSRVARHCHADGIEPPYPGHDPPCGSVGNPPISARDGPELRGRVPRACPRALPISIRRTGGMTDLACAARRGRRDNMTSDRPMCGLASGEHEEDMP